ncbi:MAG: ribonuclease HII [Gammaproteobacteria bacterium]|jgi:ribonuclease HII|nr:ribonuclease HII [Gammaproteobacteria bacterium]
MRPNLLELRMDRLVAGVDEAGRGPLAGPVVAAAVILDPRAPIQGLADSKKLSEARRRSLFPLVQARALAWGIAWADAHEIDTLNILQATMLAMRRCLLGLAVIPTHILVDGNRCPSLAGTRLDCTMEAIIGGDALVPEISAASILAKVARDAMMGKLDRVYPGYGFEGHKGYPTAVHRQRLLEVGACPVHRRSFAPVAAVLAGAR